MNTQPRKPAGSTEGGQFAGKVGAESATPLGGHEPPQSARAALAVLDEPPAALDPLAALRSGVATQAQLRALSHFPTDGVRLAVANHPSTPRDALEILADDISDDVRHVAYARLVLGDD